MKFVLTILLLIFSISVFAQQQRADSNAIHKNTVQLFDSASQKKTIPVLHHDPKKATFRSAVLPGWGQAYNKEYWKIPIVYAAIGIPAGFFVYNNKWYKKTKFAYQAQVKAAGSPPTVPPDSSDLPFIDPKLSKLPASSLQFYKNEFRKNRDYSILYFIIAWGLNVVDATVFAHLKEFDVSDDLSLQLKPTISYKSTGVGLVLNVKNNEKKLIDTNR